MNAQMRVLKVELSWMAYYKPRSKARVLIGFGSEDDWFDYQLEHDPRFLRRIEKARQSLRSRRGVKLETIEER